MEKEWFLSDGGSTDGTKQGEVGWGQEHRLRCRVLGKVGCLFLMDGQEKRNREETHFEVEGREMERVHIKV